MEHLRHIAVWWPARRVRVAGFPVRRMTLGHLRVLEAVGSPFVSGGGASAFDAAVALAILGLPWRMAARTVALPAAFVALARIYAAVLNRKPGEAAAVAAVSAHVAAHLWVPEPYVRDGEGDSASAFAPATALSLRIAVKASALNLEALLSRPVRYVFDAPVDELLLWVTCSAEISGREFEAASETGGA